MSSSSRFRPRARLFGGTQLPAVRAITRPSPCILPTDVHCVRAPSLHPLHAPSSRDNHRSRFTRSFRFRGVRRDRLISSLFRHYIFFKFVFPLFVAAGVPSNYRGNIVASKTPWPLYRTSIMSRVTIIVFYTMSYEIKALPYTIRIVCDTRVRSYCS